MVTVRTMSSPTIDGPPGGLHIVAAVTNAAMDMGEQTPSRVSVSDFLQACPEAKLLNGVVALFLIL